MPTVNETLYDDRTPTRVIETLESHRRARDPIRLRLYYGDQDTGRAWGDTDAGYIGRSMGAGPNPMRVPLVVVNSTSTGGHVVLAHTIVKIECANKRDGGVLWQHPSYHVPGGVDVWIKR